MGARKVGGIWFFRCGRARFSFCLARRVARSAGLALAQQFAAAILLGGAVGWWV